MIVVETEGLVDWDGPQYRTNPLAALRCEFQDYQD